MEVIFKDDVVTRIFDIWNKAEEEEKEIDRIVLSPTEFERFEEQISNLASWAWDGELLEDPEGIDYIRIIKQED